MNSNRITNLPEPTLPHEAVNKLYVDGTPREIFHGYVRNLRSYGSVKNDKFEFIVTASYFVGGSFHPVHALNGLYKHCRHGAEGEWKTNGETMNFWIHIQCPDLVRLWSIALRAKDSNTERLSMAVRGFN